MGWVASILYSGCNFKRLQSSQRLKSLKLFQYHTVTGAATHVAAFLHEHVGAYEKHALMLTQRIVTLVHTSTSVYPTFTQS